LPAVSKIRPLAGFAPSVPAKCANGFFPSFADGAQFEHDAVTRATIGCRPVKISRAVENQG